MTVKEGMLRDVIQLTRLNGTRVYVNPDHVRSVEARPDTVITFEDGKKIVVKETPDEVAEKVIEFRGRIIQFGNRPYPGAE